MLHLQKGFSLLELIVVVAIIGILATFAIPQYGDYVSRSQVASVHLEIAGLKSGIDTQLHLGNFSLLATDVGYTTSHFMTTAPSLLFAADGSGTLTGTIDGSVSASIKNTTLTLTRAMNGSWTCTIDASAAASWKSSYSPDQCS